MKYPYMTLEDETEVTHSSVQKDGTVKVYIETPIDGGFKNATCVLPAYIWSNVSGYSEQEIAKWEKFIKNKANKYGEK